MTNLLKHALASALLFLLGASASSHNLQGQSVATSKAPGRQVTAYASAREVRFTSLGELIQIRLEVINSSGEVVFDSGFKAGNVLDWSLKDKQDKGLADGSYLCLITVKDPSGQISRRNAIASFIDQSVALKHSEPSLLTAAQADAAVIEDQDNGLTILEPEGSAATAVVAHDGSTAHLVSGSGGLSISSGDFFANKLLEQIRLTAEGNLGIGTSNPQAKLDVSGPIRTSQGIIFPDGSIQTTAANFNGSHRPDIGQDGKVREQNKSSGKRGSGDKFSPQLNVDEDLTINGNIIFTPPSPQFTRDITMQNNNGGLRFFGAPTLTNSPAAAAIQFWGNNSPFPGQLYLDSGAHDSGAVIIRTTGTGGIIAERLRVTATGNVGIGATTPSSKLDVAGAINTSSQYNIGLNRVLSVAGSNNLFAGVGAGNSNTQGVANSFFGRDAGLNNTEGAYNSFFGYRAGRGNTTGDDNSFFGIDAGWNNTTARFNSFFGSGAGRGNTTGDNNSFFGRYAGNSNTTEENNTFIGAFSDGVAGITNATAIGNSAQVTRSDSLVLGSINGVNGAFADTKVGIGTTAPTAKLTVSGAGGFNAAGAARFDLYNTTAGIGYLQQVLDDGKWRIATLGGTSRVLVDLAGNVGIGTTAPATRLHVAASFNLAATPASHVALVENTSTGNSADGLALKIGRNSSPEAGNNFITFFKGDDASVGSIEGNGSGGVVLAGPGNDYAEWLPRLDSTESILPGDVVGVFDGRISKATRCASQVMVVSASPIVAGNDPGTDRRASHSLVAFIGQVMVRVRGAVQAGDFIVPSGKADGIGTAVSPERISAEQFEQAVGQAWEPSATPGVKQVRVAVGLIRSDPTVKRLMTHGRQQAVQIAALDARLAALEREMQHVTIKRTAIRRKQLSGR